MKSDNPRDYTILFIISAATLIGILGAIIAYHLLG